MTQQTENLASLDSIALKYGTDKSSLEHYYTRWYDMILSSKRSKELKLFEIGIKDGLSLKTWKEYFHNSEIYGLDIVDCKQFEEENISIYVGSQDDKLLLTKISEEAGPFDIIIDDGSHHNYHMFDSFTTLFPLLNKGGYYIVEDLHCCYWQKTHETGEPIFMEFVKTLMDKVNANGKSDIGDPLKDEYRYFYKQNHYGYKDYWENNVESIQLFRGIVFIKKL